MMAENYYCPECTAWVEGSEVSSREAQVKPNTPFIMEYFHEICGSEVEPEATW